MDLNLILEKDYDDLIEQSILEMSNKELLKLVVVQDEIIKTQKELIRNRNRTIAILKEVIERLTKELETK